MISASLLLGSTQGTFFHRIHVNRIVPTIKNHFKYLCVDGSESCDEASVDRAH